MNNEIINNHQMTENELLEKLQTARKSVQNAYSESCKCLAYRDSEKSTTLWQEFEFLENAMNDLKDEIQKKLMHVKL